MPATTFIGHFLGPDTHANRPAAAGLPNGTLYVCTTDSKIERVVSGAWADYATLGGGGTTELSYVQFTSSVTVTATTEAAADTVVTAAAFTADGTSKYRIELYAPGVYFGASSSPSTVRHALYEASTVIGQVGLNLGNGNSISTEAPFYACVYLTPAAGTRTYSWRAFRLNANGGVEVGAGGAGTLMPGYIRITRGG